MNEKTFKCYGCMRRKPLAEQSNNFVKVICIEEKTIIVTPVCKSCHEKFLKKDGEQNEQNEAD